MLAKILEGSKYKNVLEYRFDKCPNYGAIIK